MFKFITNRPLWINIVVAIFITMSLVVLFFVCLDWITGHNQYEKVPTVVGQNIDAAKLFLRTKGFSVEIIDSIYDPSLPKLSVTKQQPEADAVVKHGRTIYITINRVSAPTVDMPNLVGFSFKSAQMYLTSLGLKLGDTSYRPDIARNNVVAQLINGVEIKQGAKVPIGTAISFVLGGGLGEATIDIPNLIGLTYAEARNILDSNKINIGIPILMESSIKDTLSAFIIKQSPEAFVETIPGQKMPNKIKPGQLLDMWLSITPPIDTLTGKPIRPNMSIPTIKQ